MTVTLNKDVAQDLVNYKIEAIQELIQQILKRWNETSANQFLEKAKAGVFSEAENDAIELRQLLLQEEKLRTLIESF